MARTFPRAVDRILMEQGVVTSSWGHFMLVLPYRTTRATDSSAWDQQYAELVRVLRGDVEPTERHVAVLHLLALAGVSPRTFSKKLGGSGAVKAATDRLDQRASTQWPRDLSQLSTWLMLRVGVFEDRVTPLRPRPDVRF